MLNERERDPTAERVARNDATFREANERILDVAANIELDGARIGANEAIFRGVNEQVRALNVTLAAFTETMMIVCECGDRGCIDQISIAPDAYARVREDPTCFVVLPGHELPDTENVVSHEAGYVVVRKQPGLPEAIARATDPTPTSG